MASPDLSGQVSTPANSKRKASAMPFNSPPRGPMLTWNAKLDALGHCYEGELVEDQRKSLGKGAAETFLARKQNEATKHTRVSEVKGLVGTSRDAVMANLRLLNEAHQRLDGSSKDASVRYGKENLSLAEILPIFDDLNKLWRVKADKSVANIEKSAAMLRMERDELRRERDHSISQAKAARQERDRSRQERDLYLKQKNILQQERDALSQESDRYRQEFEALKRERDELQLEVQQSRHRQSEESAAEKSITIGMIPQTALSAVEKERDDSYRRVTRYRQERDKVCGEYNSMSIKKDQYQARLENMERELDSLKLQLHSSKDTNKTLEADLNVLKCTFSQERQAFKSQVDTLKNAHIATSTELDQTRNELSHALVVQRREHESELRRQRTSLQGTYNTKAQWMRAKLEHDHELNVRTLTQNWEQEKAQLVASTGADREAVNKSALAAKKQKDSYSAALKDCLNRLELSKEAAAREQETIHDLVVAIAVSLSSYTDMRSVLLRRGRAIDNHIHQLQKLDKQLMDLQKGIAISDTESSRLQTKLQGKEEELDKLSTANKANIMTLRELQDAHAACEHGQRLQLGRTDRQTFFEDFSQFADSLSEEGRVFKGQESCRDVDVCFCVLSGTNEALCVIRRFGGAFTIWHSKMEDCSTFAHSWRRWLCLGGENQGTSIYICVTSVGETEGWLGKNLAVRTVCSEEINKLRRTIDF